VGTDGREEQAKSREITREQRKSFLSGNLLD
jgi:hypothetical protein